MAAVLTVFVGIAVWRAITFCTFVGLPAFYVKDLGFDFITVEYIRHSVHGITDLKDMLGWSIWWDQPFFFFNGYLSYLATVPLSYLLGSTWESIKILEVLSLCSACAGTYWLMRLFGRRKLWSLFAALTYAAVPSIAFAPRGNLDFGIPSVLLPVVFAASVWLVRRIGFLALPFCGLLCGIIGLCAGLEFLLFVSMPAFIVIAAYAYRRHGLGPWISWASVGVVTMVLSGAYYVVPTFFGLPFSDTASRLVTLYNESFAPEFSEGFIQLLALLPKESLLSPVPYYNSSEQLPIALIPGVIIWFIASIGLTRRIEVLKTAGGATAFAVCAGLIFLSASALLLGGTEVWRLFGHVPLLNAIRTPDRFFTFPVLFIVCASADGLAELVDRLPRQRITSAFVAALIFGCLYAFAASGHVWENQQDYGAVEPDLARVNEVVAALDHRTISFAIGNGESSIDAASYGVPTSTISNYWEFAARYGQTGLAGTGIFRKAGVRTIVTSPPWGNSDVAGLPNYGQIYSSVPDTRMRFKGASGVTVLELSRPDPPVSSANISCLEGGPGLLDHLLSLQDFGSVALSKAAGRCVTSTLADEDALSDVQSLQPRLSFSGTALCDRCERLQGIDDGFDTTRYGLKMPWYRNSVDGDSPAFDSRGAVLISQDDDLVIPNRDASSGRKVLILRGAAHAYVSFDIQLPDGTRKSVRVFPGIGLRSLAVPFASGTRADSAIRIHVNVDAIDLDDSGFTWTGYALDGAAVVDEQAYLKSLKGPRSSVGIAMDPRRLMAVHSDDYNAVRFTSSTQTSHNDRPPRHLSNEMVVRWNGPAATYALEARATASSPRERLSMTVDGRRCCWSPISKDSKVVSGGVERLAHGSTIIARLVNRGAGPNQHETIDEISATRLEATLPLHAVAIGEEIGNLNFSSGPSSLAFTDHDVAVPKAAFSSLGFSGVDGTRLSFAFRPARNGNVLISFRGVDGRGTALAGLICGAQRKQANLSKHAIDQLVLLNVPQMCKVTIGWHGDLLLGRIVIKAFEAGTTLHAWLPKGRYVTNVYTSKLAAVALSHMKVDGRNVTEGSLSVQRSGEHRIDLNAVPGDTRLLTFFPETGLRAKPAQIVVNRVAALRYEVTLQREGAIKLNDLSDGNWYLSGEHRTLSGFACDVIDTCFEGIDPGRYTIVHRWSPQLRIGFALSAASVAISLATLFFGLRRFRSRALSSDS